MGEKGSAAFREESVIQANQGRSLEIINVNRLRRNKLEISKRYKNVRSESWLKPIATAILRRASFWAVFTAQWFSPCLSPRFASESYSRSTALYAANPRSMLAPS